MVYFKKRDLDIAWDKRAEKPGFVGHPPYAEWFCNEHYDKAYEFKNLTIDEAIKLLKTK